MHEMYVAFGLGMVTGGRSMLGPALAAQALRRQAHPRWLDNAARALPFLATGELIADKTPFVPARTEVTPFVGRLAFGALTGAAVVAPDRRGLGAALGALGAAAGALAFSAGRRRLTSRGGVPNVLAGLCEDVVLLSAGFWLLRSRG